MSPMNPNSKISEIESAFPEQAPELRWPLLVDRANHQSLSPAEYRTIWKNCFSKWNVEDDGPIPIWIPSRDHLQTSNVTKWQKELGIETYEGFHRWTTRHRAEFWEQAIRRLGIQLRTPAEQTLDVSQGIPQTAWLPGATLNIAESCFQADQSAIAIISQKPGGPLRKQTFGELRCRSNQVANSLVDAGFEVGDSLAVVMPMTDWSIAIYLGILMAGCNVVSIADSFAPPEIATRLELADAKAVFTYDHQNRAGRQLPLFRKVIQATDARCIVLATDDCVSVDLREQDLDWTEFLVDRSEFEPVTCTVNETINILFSSGTTGTPKAIPWSQLTPIKCAIDGYCHQNIQPGDVCAWPTNLGWMMGPWLIFASLINRATIALYEDVPMGSGFGKFVEEAKVTMLGVVPTIVKAWQASKKMEAFDWSSIKVFSSTGESSQADTMVYLSSLANIKPIIEYCGGTEIGGGYVSSVVALPNFPAAFNTPAVGIDFVLIESDQHDTQTKPRAIPGDEGEVFLIPPSIGLSSRLINRDHFQTYFEGTPTVNGLPHLRRHGDYFRRFISRLGSIFVAGGRADDTMNLGGIKISSAEIERVLNQVDGIIETAAVSHSQKGGPDRLYIFAVADPSNGAVTDEANATTASASPASETTEPNAALLSKMNKAIKSQLNPLFKIDSVQIVDSMPRTSSGKVMRRKLRDQIS